MADTSWIDINEYPFQSNFMEFDLGRMHYIDEGKGESIVMLHGNPTWSFLYRYLVKGFSDKYRCIAPDYFGFGLSAKPRKWSYLPKEQSKYIAQLIDKLEIKDITLIVQDWGGPIGLSYALKNPGNIKRLVIMNTWMWSVKDDFHFRLYSRLMGGPFGRFLITRFNFFAKRVMKMGISDKSKLTKSIHQHYLIPLKHPEDRKASWVFPKEVIGSSRWLDSLWRQKDRIKNKPTLLIWGMKDIAFREKELKTWESLFTNFKTVRLDSVGHYVQEEQREKLCPIVLDFISKN
jgi:haloalkane dehalogenase